ncbi:MAG: HupE/UreJ family protein [Steroidobacteraceae bacterium]
MIRGTRLRALLAGAALLLASLLRTAEAHETRPIYLDLEESSPGQYAITWRTPVLAGMRLPVKLQLPAGSRNLRSPEIIELPDSLLERRWVDAGPQGLTGKRIEFPGLQLTITDVLVRVQLADGRSWTSIVKPASPWIEITAAPGRLESVRTYLVQGIEHILLGVDHLLFVLGLVLLVRSTSMLVKTITAFTVAHSITLAIATLGYAHVPSAPLNAAIAMSILFLGPEVLRAERGGTSFTIRHPWVVAFGFGLLHGFGFASGLSAIGIPQGEIPLALLSFNVGVEIGQLAFVAVVLLLARSFRVLEVRWPRAVEVLPAYMIGVLGAFWTIQRVVMMVQGA